MKNGMNSIKMVAVDMDGTFLRSDNTYDRSRFESILKRMRSQKAKFVVASGNQYYQLRDFFSADHQQLAFVAENGAFVKDKDTMIFSQQISREVVEKVIDLCLSHPEIDMLMCGLDSAYCQKGTVSQELFETMSIYYHRLKWVDDLKSVQDQILKFALTTPAGLETEICGLLKQELNGLLEPVTSGHRSIDLIVPGCHKASGLKRLAERWQIDSKDCAAFGDSANDIEMLQYCGHSYAMANADEAVKQAACSICPSNNEDGVLAVLDELYPA